MTGPVTVEAMTAPDSTRLLTHDQGTPLTRTDVDDVGISLHGRRGQFEIVVDHGAIPP